MLTPHLAHLLGVQLPGGHGEHAQAGHTGVGGPLGHSAGFAGRGSGGRVVPGRIGESGAGRLLRGIQLGVRSRDQSLRPGRGPVSEDVRHCLAGLWRPHGVDLPRVSRPFPSGSSPTRTRVIWSINAQLPDGASLDRTDKIVKQMSAIARDAEKVPGVWHTIDLPGYSALLGTNISNVGGMFVILEPFEERKGDPQRSAAAIAAKLRQQYGDIRGGRIAVFGAPAIDGLGTTGGFKLQVQDRRGAGLRALQGAVRNLADQGNAEPAPGRLVQQLHGEPAPDSSWKSTATSSRPRRCRSTT